MIFGFASLLISVFNGCRLSFIEYWLLSLDREIVACSLPHHDNECQWSVNDFWFYNFGNLSCEWLQAVINEVLAACV